MPVRSAVYNGLAAIEGARVIRDAPLSEYTRFAIGGPAALLVDADSAEGFTQALDAVESCSVPHVVIGGGTNLVVSDDGFDGVVLHYTGREIDRQGETLHVQAGAVLQDVVDYSIAAGLYGLQTMTGIPGYLGGAIFGNAGAYGRSIHEIVERVHWTDGKAMHAFSNAECEFTYRESIFKRNRERVVLSAELRFGLGDAAELARTAREIRAIRDEKYPPTMRCAGSIFKNLFFAHLPKKAQEQVPSKLIREGKVASAWFLEQAGAKGLRIGDIQVATYHANLIYNDRAGTAADLVKVIEECKRRVMDRFGFELEEEVQYIG